MELSTWGLSPLTVNFVNANAFVVRECAKDFTIGDRELCVPKMKTRGLVVIHKHQDLFSHRHDAMPPAEVGMVEVSPIISIHKFHNQWF